MAIPFQYDHTIQAGEDYHFAVEFEENGEPLNLAGVSLECYLLNVLKVVQAVAEVELTNPSAGEITIKFSRQQTRNLKGPLQCVVKVVGATGNTQYLLRGDVRVEHLESPPTSTEPLAGEVLGVLPLINGSFNSDD